MGQEWAKKERCEKKGWTGGQTALPSERDKSGFSSVQQVRGNYRSSELRKSVACPFWLRTAAQSDTSESWMVPLTRLCPPPSCPAEARRLPCRTVRPTEPDTSLLSWLPCQP